LETVFCGSCNSRLARRLWAALEASPSTVHSCFRHRGPTRTLAFENALFLLKFLVPGVNGYSAGWFHVKLCAKCTLHSCYSFFAICRTQQLLCCGVAILKTSGI
jgi:hypothetical protein